MPETDDNTAILSAINHLSNSLIEMRKEQHENMALLARAADVRALRHDLEDAKDKMEDALRQRISAADCATCRANLVDKRTFKGWAAAFILFGPILTAMFVLLANHYLP